MPTTLNKFVNDAHDKYGPGKDSWPSEIRERYYILYDEAGLSPTSMSFGDLIQEANACIRRAPPGLARAQELLQEAERRIYPA